MVVFAQKGGKPAMPKARAPLPMHGKGGGKKRTMGMMNGHGGGAAYGDFGPEPFAFIGASSQRRKMELMGLIEGADSPPGSWGAPPPPPPQQQASSKRGRQQQAVVVEEPEPELPTCTWLKLPEGMTFCLENGLPSGAVALQHGPWLQRSGLLAGASNMLAGMVDGDVKEEVEILHDAEWEQFPEIGEAVKEAIGEESSVAVAVCRSKCQWAIGLAGKWKFRESAAKLALCLAMLPEAENCSQLCGEWPQLAQLCDLAGVATGVEVPTPAPRSKPIHAAKKTAAVEPIDEGGASLPRDVPLWISMAGEETPPLIDGMPMHDVLAVCTDGNKRKALYSQSEKVLAQLVDDPENDVQFHDDFNWDHFASVGRALQKYGEKEECLCVAACPSMGCWAVGVGMKGKNRYAAAKCALVATLAIQAPDMELGEHSAVAEFVEEVKMAQS